MSNAAEPSPGARYGLVNLDRLHGLGDAIFAFALTLLALDLRLPEIDPADLGPAMLALLPRLLIFVFAFLVIAQEWDVHQRTMMHIARVDGVFVWLWLLSLMFVVLMPATADILGRFPLQAFSLVFFGSNVALLCLVSFAMWQYASRRGKLIEDSLSPQTVKMIARLWLFPPIIIVCTMPLGFINVFPVYLLWLLMPIASYGYSAWALKRRRESPSVRQESQ